MPTSPVQGVFLPEGKTALHTYAFFFVLAFNAGSLFAYCRNAGCNAKLKITVEGGKKLNVTAHFVKYCPGHSVLTLKDFFAKMGSAAAVADEDERPGAGAGVGSGGGGGAKRKATGPDKTAAIEALTQALVTDGQLLSTVERLGWRTFLSEAFNIPIVTSTPSRAAPCACTRRSLYGLATGNCCCTPSSPRPPKSPPSPFGAARLAAPPKKKSLIPPPPPPQDQAKIPIPAAAAGLIEAGIDEAP